ncbi:MAG: hypothetical protein MI892_07620 [Desulfobacterales bacterium]|nr:hypothetical protein [Desulfobacterales bacterium]
MDKFWFKTNLFDIEANEDEETNPGIYGKQFAHWLSEQLTLIGYSETECFSEDWGWCIIIFRKPFMLLVGCSSVYGFDNVKKGDSPPSKDEVVWSCSVMTKLPVFKNPFKKKIQLQQKKKLCREIQGILAQEPQIQFVDEP